MNRVKITYAIDLDDVPTTSQLLLDESVGWMRGALGALEDINLASETASFQSVAETAHKIRTTLNKIDQRLDDCLSVMAGYHQTVIGLSIPEGESEAVEHDPTEAAAAAMSEQIRLLQRQASELANYGGYDESEEG